MNANERELILKEEVYAVLSCAIHWEAASLHPLPFASISGFLRFCFRYCAASRAFKRSFPPSHRSCSGSRVGCEFERTHAARMPPPVQIVAPPAPQNEA